MAQYVLQIIISGLEEGALFALTALGLVVIYNVSTVVNFAHGAMGAVATYVAYALFIQLHAPFFLALLGALVVAFLLGALVQHFFLDRLRSGSALTQIVLTLGLFMLLEGLLGIAFGYDPRTLVLPFALPPLLISTLVVPGQAIIQFAALVLFGFVLIALFSFTRLGLGLRATTENEYAAYLMGIPVGRVRALAWGLGILLAAIAALLASPTTSVTPDMMDTMLVYGFVAAILGGFGSLPGAAIGGLLVGVLVNFIDAFLAPELATSIVFGLLVLVLYLKPDGLFGHRLVQKV